MVPPPPRTGLTVGTVAAADEAIRLLKRIRKERCASVRAALLSAVEQLVDGMVSAEQHMSSGSWPPGAD